jgi:nucleotide-binding universal stress UspA family protein
VQRAARILLGHDAAPGGDDAAALAALLAGADGEVHALLAIPYPPRRIGDPPIHAEPGPGNWEQISAELEAKGNEALERRALSSIEAAKSFGDVVIDNSPSAALSAISEAERPDFIVVGSSRYGRLGKVLIGSTGEQLAHGSVSPVAIAPRGYAAAAPERIGSIAVGFDGGGEAEHALELAARLARRHGAGLRVIGVLETTVSEGEIIAEAYDAISGKPIADRRKQELTTRIDEAVARFAADLPVSVEIERGRVADRLIDTCKQGTDLLVVGSRGYGPLARVLLGSTSTRLAREAPCPLVIATRRSY